MLACTLPQAQVGTEKFEATLREMLAVGAAENPQRPVVLHAVLKGLRLILHQRLLYHNYDNRNTKRY